MGNKQLLTCLFRLVQLSTEETSQSVECLTVERGIAGSIPGAGPILGILKCLRNVGTPFALQMATPSRGSDDYIHALLLPPQRGFSGTMIILHYL